MTKEALASPKDAALKLALEALEPDVYRAEWAVEQDREKAITAIKAALAQPTSGDYAHGYVEGFNDACMPKPAQQEPVAFLVDDDLYYPEEIDWETLQEQGHTVAALYTSPPAQRTWGKPWVSLTDDEIQKMRHLIDWTAGWSYNTFARAVEAKLKEKNT